jgi:catechol 1,2-dioxygenase
MNAARTPESSKERLSEIFEDLVASLTALIRKHRITHAEYRRAVAFLIEAADRGEIPLLADVFLEVTVDDVGSAGRPNSATATCIEGPFYVPNAPTMKSPCVLPHRPNEPGDVLFFSGAVRSTDGAALSGALVDIWHADAIGAYSHFNIPEREAPYNLRARVIADEQGRFDIRTLVTAPYEIPKAGPTGALLTAMGRHPWRPAHFHVKVTHDTCEPLTTQLFLRDDPWIDSDVVGAVKQPLVVSLTKHDDPDEFRKRHVDRTFYTLSYDFVLPRSIAGQTARA